MDKKTRFRPASFIEIDDLYGGRKITMVGADGITYWDALNVDSVTPIVIHPIFNPVEVGIMIEFARKNDLIDGLRALAQNIDESQDGRAQCDPLYVMRALVAYSKGSCDNSVEAIDKAIRLAGEEQLRAIGAQLIYENCANETARDLVQA